MHACISVLPTRTTISANSRTLNCLGVVCVLPHLMSHPDLTPCLPAWTHRGVRRQSRSGPGATLPGAALPGAALPGAPVHQQQRPGPVEAKRRRRERR